MITVHDAFGKAVISEVVSSYGVIELSQFKDLPSGVYSVTLISEQKKFTSQVIKY